MRFENGLHMPVKFYSDPLRFGRVIREKPILTNTYYSVVYMHDSIQ